MRLRQVAFVAKDLSTVAEQIHSLFGVPHAYNDPGVGKFGLGNIVVPIGDTFLEVVSPQEEGTTAGRYLERRGGDGGYMVLLQIAGQATIRKRMEEMGVRIVWQMDHDDITGTHLHPRDTGGAILSLDEATPTSAWRWAGPGWEEQVNRDVVEQITGVEIQSQDPEAMAKRWGEILQVEAPTSVTTPHGEEFHLSLPKDASMGPTDPGVVRFALDQDGRGDGVSALDVAVHDEEAFRTRAAGLGLLREDQIFVCGVRINGVKSTGSS